MQKLLIAATFMLGSLASPSFAEVVSPEAFWQHYHNSAHSGRPLIIDVRTHDEFIAGHLPNAVNIPFDRIDGLATIAPDKKQSLFIYCRSGRRSGIAEEALTKLGYTQIYNGESYQALKQTQPQ